CLDREWKADDKLTLDLPASIKVKTWEGTNTVSVVHGPLTYSLAIKEKYVRYGGTDQWPAYDIIPDSPWNYGLDSNEEHSLIPAPPKLSELPGLVGQQPIFDRSVPGKITAKARRIPAWTLDRRGLVNEVAPGPVKTRDPVEKVPLTPMGAARLRITAFPRIDNDKGKDWPPPTKPKYLASASHCWDHDSVDALCD